jgi:DNA-binding NarL/FixJ family response regulator
MAVEAAGPGALLTVGGPNGLRSPGAGHAARRHLGTSQAGRGAPPAPDGLTQREVEILAMIAHGLTNPKIAAKLFLSNHTIKTHLNRIFAKTGSRDRAAAIGYAHRKGIAQ